MISRFIVYANKAAVLLFLPFSIGSRGFPRMPLENRVEELDVAIADICGDINHFSGGFPEQPAGFIHTDLLDVL